MMMRSLPAFREVNDLRVRAAGPYVVFDLRVGAARLRIQTLEVLSGRIFDFRLSFVDGEHIRHIEGRMQVVLHDVK